MLAVGLVFVVGPSVSSERLEADSQVAASSNCGTWQILTKPNLNLTPYGGEFRAIAAISDDDIWIIGESEGSDTQHRSLFVHWDGTKLVAVPVQGPPTTFWKAIVLSRDNVWALGYNLDEFKRPTTGDPIMFHWDGIQWSIVPGPTLPTSLQDNANKYTYMRIAPVSKNDIWAFGGYGITDTLGSLIQHWDGVQWSSNLHPNISGVYSGVSEVAVLSSNDIWALGNTGEAHTYESLLHWDGAGWKVKDSTGITTTTHWLYGIAATKSDNVWAFGDITRPELNGNVQTLAARWDQNGWTITHTPGLPLTPDRKRAGWDSIYDVAIISDNDIWAVVSEDVPPWGGTLVLHWNGTNWSSIPGPVAAPKQELYSIAAAPDGDSWVAGLIIDESKDYQSSYYTWQNRPLLARFVRCK